MKQADIYSLITNRIIEKMNQGVIAWQRGYSSVAPQNFVSKKEYRGINFLIAMSNDFKSPYYLSFKQAKELGGGIKQGEKGTPIVYWQILDKESRNADGIIEKKKIPLLKYYTVFNAEQCTGINFPIIENSVPNIQLLEELIQNMNERPKIKEGQNFSPCYSPMQDEVRMPLKESYISSARYYKTLFHELGHWTGASTRLNREGITKFDRFGSHQYSIEELIAEMTASYAMNFAGLELETIENSAAYIQSWIKVLKNDNKFIFKAAKDAEVAWKFLNNDIEVGNVNKKAA